MFDPWKVVDAHPSIIVELREFDSWSGATNGTDRIYLDPRLLQVERRCTLTHELVHISRQHVSCQPLTVEQQVRAVTSRLLVDVRDLRREMRWARSHVELAAELMVTPRVLSDRLAGLSQGELKFLGDDDLSAVLV